MGAETGTVATCRWHASALQAISRGLRSGEDAGPEVLPGNEKFQPIHKGFAGILWKGWTL